MKKKKTFIVFYLALLHFVNKIYEITNVYLEYKKTLVHYTQSFS